MRIQPRPSLAWAIGIGYAILFLVLAMIMGVGYDVIGTTTDNIIKGLVVPVGIGALVLIAVILVIVGAKKILRPKAAAQAPATSSTVAPG
jgi:hypothetical protein